MKIIKNILLVAAFASFFLVGNMAQAGIITFNFNSTSLSGSAGNGLGATGSSAAIQTSMNAALSAAGYGTSSVAVSGALATATYNGEGYVIGETLGTSDHGVHHVGTDTFIINDNFGLHTTKTDFFTLTFTNFLITSVSFDWEIFPDITCAKGTGCGPDITFGTDKTPITIANPNGLWHVVEPASSTINPQGLGTVTGLATNGAYKLTFEDWPAEIGIDNLVITGCTPGNCIPEPTTLALMGLGLLSLFLGRRRLLKDARI